MYEDIYDDAPDEDDDYVYEEFEKDLAKPTPTRVRIIFSVMANPNRINVLRILSTKKSLQYSQLKRMAGFSSKKESGKFAYHLRKLLRQDLVAGNKVDKHYTITNLGKLVVSLTKQIEARSIIERGTMYVRTSSLSIEEFNSDKILQSLLREGRLPRELAQKITEDVEDRIYKYQASYLTGPMIREITNAVLLENGYEDYRNVMTRLGMPPYDIQHMLTNADRMDGGIKSTVLSTGRHVLCEYLLTNTLHKDMADMYLSGEIHIAELATWSLTPDTIFVDAGDILGEDSWRSGLPRRTIQESPVPVLATVLDRISQEASMETVVSGLPEALQELGMDERSIADALIVAHAATGSRISIRAALASDATGAVIDAYGDYVRAVDRPRMGLVLDSAGVGVGNFMERLSLITRSGGVVSFGTGQVAGSGINGARGLATSQIMHSVSVNLPRIAMESNNDQMYFRAKLSLMLDPIVTSMDVRRKDVSDISRRGLNPFLAGHAGYRQKESVGLVINLVGLPEAVTDIMKYRGREAYEVCLKTTETASKAAEERSHKLGTPVSVCMVPAAGSARLMDLDMEKYGRKSASDAGASGEYSQGKEVDVRQAILPSLREDTISEIREMAGRLHGGFYTKLLFHPDTPVADLREVAEGMAGRCGFALAAVRRD